MDIAITYRGQTLRGKLEGMPKLEAKELVILFHGFQGTIGYEPGKLLYDLSEVLTQAGIANLRVNFSGCGDSDGKFEDMTVLNEIEDAMAVINYARQVLKAERIHLVGHSQGGVVASMVAPAYPDFVKSLTLLASAATLKDDAIKGECQGSTYDPNHVPDLVEVQGVDVGGNYFRLAQYLPIYEMAANYQGPVKIIHGDNDQIVSHIASDRYAAIYDNADYVLMKGADHGLAGPDNQRQQTIEAVVAFLKEH